jgi:allophanate hydrolase
MMKPLMVNASAVPRLDLVSLAGAYQAGEARPYQVVSSLCRHLEKVGKSPVWIYVLPTDSLINQAEAVEKRGRRGDSLPLYGVPFAVKDNIDVACHPTTAGCPAFSYIPQHSGPVVARLLEAGAILIGKTNLDQFGAGLAGDRSPYGACHNVFDAKYISGGSSSGSAVAVASGLVSFALGTDTAGSGRVPAGCNNIVGLKPTSGLLSTDGMVPSCRSLDCLSIFALTVSDAWQVFEVARGALPTSPLSRPASSQEPDQLNFTFAIPREEDLDFFGDDGQALVFARAVKRLEQLGARKQTIDYKPFREIASLLYEGPWLAERLSAVDEFLAAHPSEVYPVTLALLQGGAAYSAVDAFKAFERLRILRKECLKVFESAQLFVVPTMPCLPTLAEVQNDSKGWSRRLGTYTNFVNFLQLPALALPAGFTQKGLPGGVTFIGPPGSDRRLCEWGTIWQRACALPLGATGKLLPSEKALNVNQQPTPAAEGFVRVAVAGAHLRGQPFHQALLRMEGKFVRAARTAARYCFLAFLHLDPPRPGLLRDDDHGGAVTVEIYDFPIVGFGKLVASVAPPLAIGTIELADGEKVKGFLCESWDAKSAVDITDFGGWLAFRDYMAKASPGALAAKEIS